MDELNNAWENARSIESIPENAGRTIYIGERISGNRKYIFYRDNAWNYWYQTRITTEKGIVSEYEAIFGRKGKKRYHESCINY